MIKWIGQHIVDFIARFRSDVYLEDIADGTVVDNKFLGLDSNNKVVKEAASATVTDLHTAGVDGADNQLLTDKGDGAITSEANATYDGTDLSLISTTSLKPIVSITNSHNDANSSELLFINNRTGDVVAQDDDEIGKITFQGTNSKTGGTEDINYGRILCDAQVITDGAEMGRMTMSVGRLNAYTDLLQGYAGAFGTNTTFGDGGFLGTNIFNSTVTTFQSTTSTGPLFTIANLTNDATSGSILFMNDRGQSLLDGSSAASSNGDELGKIIFRGFRSTPSACDFAQILAEANEVTAGSEEGKLTLSVASHDAEMQPGLMMVSGNAEDEVDVTIGNAATSLTTVAGTLTMGSTATINNSGVVQVAAQTVIDHDQLANFAANEHYTQANIVATGALNSGSITDGFTSIDVGAGGITTTGAISGGTIDATTDFTVGTTVITDDSIVMTPSTNDTFTIAAAANGATTLTTVDTAATAAHFEIAADGNITLDAAGDIALEAGGGTVTIDSGVEISNDGGGQAPHLKLLNANADADGPFIQFFKSADGADGDSLGKIVFKGDDEGGGDAGYGQIQCLIADATPGEEAGKLQLKAAQFNHTLTVGLELDGDTNVSGEVDVNIAAGSGSTTTIAGGLVVTTGRSVNVASEAQAPIGMQIARRTITTAEANAMNSTPIELVPAQGADTIIEVVRAVARIDRAATQTNSAADMNLHYAGKEPGVFGSASLAHFRRFAHNKTTDTVERRLAVEGTSGVTLTEDVNAAVEVSFDSATTTNCFTSIDMYVTYFVIDIS